MNLYGYAGGDPINRSDPFGLRDTVVTAGPAEEADVVACRTNDVCRAAYDSAHAAPHLVMLQRVNNDAVCGTAGPTACTEHWNPGNRIFYSPGDLGKAAAKFGVGQVSLLEVLAHEFAHAAFGKPELIPRMFQNSTRASLSLPLITKW